MRITVEIGETALNYYTPHGDAEYPPETWNFENLFKDAIKRLSLIDYSCKGGGLFPTHTLVYDTTPMKSADEIAAEESVAKAKEALKAAENALKVVKENK